MVTPLILSIDYPLYKQALDSSNMRLCGNNQQGLDMGSSSEHFQPSLPIARQSDNVEFNDDDATALQQHAEVSNLRAISSLKGFCSECGGSYCLNESGLFPMHGSFRSRCSGSFRPKICHFGPTTSSECPSASDHSTLFPDNPETDPKGRSVSDDEVI
ncbi:hypothetical protein ACOME3_007471 [Neoechinorhynchus agilis]